MLEASISALIPTEQSEEFYRNFYNRYNFIQVNDVMLRMIADSSENYDLVLEKLEGYNSDQQDLSVYSIAAGIMNPSLMRRRKENRGISTELFRNLLDRNISPLEWYINALEFLMLYSVCEQSMKEYILSVYEPKTIKEDNIIDRLFDALTKSELRDTFLKELADSSSAILKSQNELKAVWLYYTEVRHTLAHSGGFITNRVRKKIADVKKNNYAPFRSIYEAMMIELGVFSQNYILSIVFKGKIINLSSQHLNFFRNMTVMVIESIERAIHPDEYAIKDFDPYKL